MKAILINVKKQEIQEITIKNTPEAINKALNCLCTSTPYKYLNGDVMLIDDEALYNSEVKHGGFYFPDWSYPILGSALIVGMNEDGECEDCHSIPSHFDEIIWLSVAETMEQQYQVFAMLHQ